LEYNETLHQLFIDFKEAYDSVRREDGGTVTFDTRRMYFTIFS
jgi:hypothetical protein